MTEGPTPSQPDDDETPGGPAPEARPEATWPQQPADGGWGWPAAEQQPPPPAPPYGQQPPPPAPPYGQQPAYAPYGQQPAFAPYGAPYGYDPQAKSKLAAGLLGIFLGGLGIHRFYLGFTAIGVIQIVVTILTCGLGSIWGLVEGILYLAGANGWTTDASGRPLRE